MGHDALHPNLALWVELIIGIWLYFRPPLVWVSKEEEEEEEGAE